VLQRIEKCSPELFSLVVHYRAQLSSRDFCRSPVQGNRKSRRLKSISPTRVVRVGRCNVRLLPKSPVRSNTCVSLVLGHTFEFSRLNVTQADVISLFLFRVRASSTGVDFFITVSSNEAQTHDLI